MSHILQALYYSSYYLNLLEKLLELLDGDGQDSQNLHNI